MASLRMANQIGLDAGLMHVWCSVWVNALALPAMIAQTSDSHASRYMWTWWFHDLIWSREEVEDYRSCHVD